MKDKLIIIGGPTGVGKTDISLNLAKRVKGEIISADSMQIYKGMDIGSDKVLKDQRKDVPHHLLDVISPHKSFTVSDYKDLGEKAIKSIHKKGHIPIMVGGTGLYIDSIIKNLSFASSKRDLSYRKELEDLAKIKGNDFVHDMLKEVDKEASEKIHKNNLKRVIRALEVYKTSGKPFSSFKEEMSYKEKYDIYYYFLNKDRKKLYEDINSRVDEMISLGLIGEVKTLKDEGLTKDYTSMMGIGYKEVISYLDGDIDEDEMLYSIKKNSRNYAKRQLTWFRREKIAIELSKDILSDNEIIDKIINDIDIK